MIIVRFKQTFRERAPEWVLSAGLLAWGLGTLLSSGLFFDQPFFLPMLRIMSQSAWGVAATVLGAARLLFLIVNGAWRPSAHLRAVGCILGAMLWGNLLIAGLSLGWTTPTSNLYATFLVLDLLSLWFAAGDAKLADLASGKKSLRS